MNRSARASAQSVRIGIDNIAAGGAGVGRLPDGRAAFVARTAPGDEATVRIEVEKKRWARARLVRLEHEGQGRRSPPCPLYARCGGCSLQHLDIAAQRNAKAVIVADALRRIGGFELDEPEVVAAPNEFDYRNRATFTVVRAAGGVVAGFHALEAPGRIVDVDARCMLLEPALRDAWQALREGWGPGAEALPGGPRLRLTLRSAEAGCSLLIEGGTGRGRPEALLAAVPALRSIWVRREPGAAPRRVAGENAVRDDWGGDLIALRGTVFLQVNRAVAERLEAHVLERAQPKEGQSVIDAYCGVGILTRRLAARGARVTGIELDADAAAEAAARAPMARIAVGRVEELLAPELPADLLIVNPPRTGMHELACAAVRETPPRRLLYVSCDPATLARDVARIGPGFQIRSVRCFDMFPQTAHVETVLELACVTS